MNFRPPLRFQRHTLPSIAPQKSNLETMMESIFLAQQMQNEYIKQLASKIDVLITHNKMLEAQIVQQTISSSTALGGLPSKHKLSSGSNIML